MLLLCQIKRFGLSGSAAGLFTTYLILRRLMFVGLLSDDIVMFPELNNYCVKQDVIMRQKGLINWNYLLW